MTDAGPHAWIADTSLGEQVTLSVVRSDDPDAVLRAYAGDDDHTLHHGQPGAFGDVDRSAQVTDPGAGTLDLLADDRVSIWALARDGWVIVCEPQSFRGTEPDVARRLAAPEHAVVSWHINGGESFTVWRHGRSLSQAGIVDVLLFDDHRDEHVARWLRDVPADDGDDADHPGWAQIGLLLIERATGVRVTLDDLTVEQTLMTVVEDGAPGDPELAGAWSFGGNEDEDGDDEGEDGDDEGETATAVYQVSWEHGGGRDLDVEPPRVRRAWEGPSDDVVGGVAPISFELAASSQAVVRLRSVVAQPDGLLLVLDVFARRVEVRSDVWHAVRFPQGRPPGAVLRVTVRFADGRTASTLDRLEWDEPPTRPQLVPLQAEGGAQHTVHELWLWPLPPPGPLVVEVSWPKAGIEARVELDTDAVPAAVAAARPLPWAGRDRGRGTG